MWLNKVQISDHNIRCYSTLLTIKVNQTKLFFNYYKVLTEQKTVAWRVECFAAVVS